MKEVLSYPGCFVCGQKNAYGIKARFYFDGQSAFTEMIATPEFEGYKGIFHGGIVASLLDEVMIKAVLAQDIYAVTAELTIRFKAPIRTGEKIKFVGRIVESKGRIFTTEGEATGENGAVFATATATYLQAKPELKEQLLQSLE